MNKVILMAMLSMLVISTAAYAKSSRFGEQIPDKIETVKLKNILEAPKEYKDKNVLLQGNFGGLCCATDFNYKEGLESIEVHPKGFDAPKLKVGTPVNIHGTVKVIEKADGNEVHIEAKGMETK